MRDVINLIENADKPIMVHKLEELGLGKGPFKVVGLVSIPSSSMAEQNPSAYNAAIRNLPQGIGVGTCAACGTPIMHNFIIKSADGEKHCLGSECIKKIDDARLTTQAKEVVRKKKQEEKLEKLRAQAAAREAKLQAEKERNGGLTDYELAQQARRDAHAAAMAPRIEKLAPLADALADGKRGFRDSVAQDLKNGNVPSGRGRDIMLDILSKQAGRSGSAAYDQRWNEIQAILDKIEG